MTRLLILLMSVLAVSACTEEGKYPVSGEECTAGDPVQDVTPVDCAALPTGTGSF